METTVSTTLEQTTVRIETTVRTTVGINHCLDGDTVGINHCQGTLSPMFNSRLAGALSVSTSVLFILIVNTFSKW